MPNAIISVFDKTRIDFLGKILIEQGYTIYATCGTRKALEEYKIPVKPIEEITGNPMGFENFLSSLSFNTMIGALAENEAQFNKQPIEKIDLVVYNFVPTWSEIDSLNDFNILNVDLGGPTMIKSAAINYKYSLPVVDPKQYDSLKCIEGISMQTRKLYAIAALEYCAEYDKKLAEFLREHQ